MVGYSISGFMLFKLTTNEMEKAKVKQGYTVSDFHSVLNQKVYIYQGSLRGKGKEWRWAEG